MLLYFPARLCHANMIQLSRLTATNEFALFRKYVKKARLVAVLEEHKQARLRQEEERRRLRVTENCCIC
jgi:hypothetical protein